MRKTKTAKGKSQNPVGAFSIENAGDQIVKRMTIAGQPYATGAGTVLPVFGVDTDLVQSAPAAEWASFAARYQQYRVRALRVTGKATQPVQSAAISHSVLYRGDFIGSAVPSTFTQVFSDENVRQVATSRDFVDIVTWKRNPNAKLWNPTTAAVPAANKFGWAAGSPTLPALTTGTTYYALSYEYEVEFRGSQ